MTLAPGSSLSHYAILGPLGAGAMGEVYRAKDTRLGREVAIKVLPEHFADEPERLKRFEREAKTLAPLNHPHVAQIFSVDQVGDICFLVLELVPGEALERGTLERYSRGQWFRDGSAVMIEAAEPGRGMRYYVQQTGNGAPRPVTPEGTSDGLLAPDERRILARGPSGTYFLYAIDSGEPRPQAGLVAEDGLVHWSICRQIAEGLEAAHEAGVIHRDLKPANIRVTPDGKVKVLDFGLAKPANEGESGSSTDSVLSTEAGRLLGTPTYMAPEQARGKSIDKRVDIWAFGCVLFESLTARRAFEGETLTDVFAAVIEREPDWAKLPAPTPSRVREFLHYCLAKDPRQLTNDAYKDRTVSGSPDGKTLLFKSTRTGRWQTWSIRFDGSGLTQVGEFDEGDVGGWSPDGSRVILMASQSGSRAVASPIPAAGGG